MTKPPVAGKLAVGHMCVRQLVFWLLVVSSFNYFEMHAWSTSMLLLLHLAFMLSVVKLLLKGEVGVCALNSHGNYIVDHGKSWKNHGIVFLNFYGNPVLVHTQLVYNSLNDEPYYSNISEEHSDSVVLVECLTPNQAVVGLSLTRGTALIMFLSKTLYHLLSTGSTQEDMSQRDLKCWLGHTE